MRSRSNTVYAKQSPCLQPKTQPPQPSPLSAKPTHETITKLFEEFGPMTYSCGKDCFTGDFGSHATHIAEGCSTASTSVNDVRSREVSKGDCNEFEEGALKVNRLFRGMIIGPGNRAGWELANGLYPNNEEEIGFADNSIFDLVTRHVEKENVVERYHFWMKKAGEGGDGRDALMNVYYQACSTFLLIYDEDDRTTLERLSYEVSMIKSANTKKDILLILVKNKESKTNCEISFEEVREFRKNSETKMILESNSLEELREIIQSRMT